MDRLEILLTIAEISVALAGFAGIVVLFLRGEAGRWLEVDVIRFVSMIASSLGALLFALLPLPLFEAGIPETYAWVGCSYAFAIFAATFSVVGLQATIRRGRDAFNPYLLGLVVGGSLAVAVVLLLNGLGILFHRGFTGYLVGLMWFVVVAAIFFARLVYLGIQERIGR